MHAMLPFVLILAAATTPLAAAIVTLDTSALAGHTAGPFSLNFQMNDGSGTGNANNTATLDNFLFDGGGPAGTATLFGGASGSLRTGVMITDSSFFNSFIQEITPGSILSFDLRLTGNMDAPAPDQFSFAILDNTGVEIPTMGFGEVGSDVLLIVDIGAAIPEFRTFATDDLRFPAAGGDAIQTGAPVVIPEPGSMLLMSAGIALLVWRRLRR